MRKVVSRIGITPVGSSKYRVYRLRFHLLAYAIARKAKLLGKDSTFIVRCDDTNNNNVNRDFLDPYLSVLDSLGIIPDLTPYDDDDCGFPLFQSKRGGLYKFYIDRLTEMDLAFKDTSGAIFFNPEKFANKFQSILVCGKLLVSDVSMGVTAVDLKSPLREKRGKIGFVPFALMRSNGEYLFNLCSPVDDAVLGVTHVVRDRNKLNVLAKQEMVRVALGFPSIMYVHAPFLVNDGGQKFVHNDYWGDATFQDFIARGILPEALVSYLLSGLNGPSECYYPTLDDFAVKVNLSQIHQSSTVFTESVLKQHNKKAIENSSEKSYKMGIRRYLSFYNAAALAFFDSDIHLSEMVVKMKREFSESATIIENISSPLYDVPDIDNIYAFGLVSDFLTKIVLNAERNYIVNICDMATINASHLGISKKKYFQSIRYLLTGKLHGCDLREVVGYFESSGRMIERLLFARDKLSEFNILKANGG